MISIIILCYGLELEQTSHAVSNKPKAEYFALVFTCNWIVFTSSLYWKDDCAICTKIRCGQGIFQI